MNDERQVPIVSDIVGRAAPVGVIEALLDDAIAGQGSALVLRGEAGIGKSVLLDRAIGTARGRGMRVLRVAGVQAEGQIPYAGLDHLLRPLRPVVAAASSPYRRAIDVLDLLSRREEPVLLAIEDAHWLDDATWETLTLLCRRIESDRVAVVMAVRDGEDIDRRLSVAALRELRLEPLSPEDAGTLLDRTAPDLLAALRARVLDEAAGNPLGLVELGSAAARSGSAALLPSSLPLTTRVEQTFGGLVADLPPLTRDLLLIAALNDGANLDETLAAARVMTGAPVPAEAIQPAVTARLVTVDEQYDLRFRHPLLRSALRQQAPPGRRRRVHAALAETLSGSPQREVWHRASAASGPDETLARELTKAAQRAADGQAVSIALAAVDRAVQLSQDPSERARRQLWALHLTHEQGDIAGIRQRMGDIDETALRPAERARLAWIRDSYAGGAWTGPERTLGYADLVESMLRAGDPELATQSMMDVALRVWFSNVPPPIRDRFVEVTLRLPADDPRRIGILALVAPVEYGAAGLDEMRRLVDRTDLPPTWRNELANAARAVGAFDLAATFAMSAAGELRAQGRIGTLSQALVAAAAAYAGMGDARTALPLALECIALAEEVGQPMWAVGAGLMAALADALRGDTVSARQRADVAERVFSAARRFPMLSGVQRARGVAALAEGHAEDAFRQLMRAFDPEDPAYHGHQRTLLLGHLAEAAMLGGFLDELAPVVAELEPIAAQSGSPALRVGLGFARAVLTGDYAAALAGDLTAWPFDRARLQLFHGASLRRSYRAAESRPLLRAAADTFDALGAAPWADRARAELRATGEARRGPAGAIDALTPQEQQIVRLAADGLSNREIGERLFLSPRTVSTHLYRIYPKLNVRSRAELARILDPPAPG
ncbi:LuxR family transcriptional regulator [Actinoplanes philippinensis]|uniref:AAA ATPase domain-containing protein n=1 Tax=Actinoplanes philippinensis TaxID=35752 RepID=A0A1I2A6Z3_9ACTN|nr:LuxR family transcriptional regulator [Actinoplanes philippinensis]SFE39519.1 AAA ATPase domain-containing protein [Actinoplanes philippinensis]